MKTKTKEEIEKILDSEYPIIPLNKITDEARIIALRWGENMVDDDIMNKAKLASDIMNFAKRYANQSLPSSDAVEFAEWITKNGYVIVGNEITCMDSDDGSYYSPSQLYSIFLKEKGGKG